MKWIPLIAALVMAGFVYLVTATIIDQWAEGWLFSRRWVIAALVLDVILAGLTVVMTVLFIRGLS